MSNQRYNFNIGDKVRIIDGDHAGQCGKIHIVGKTLAGMTLENGDFFGTTLNNIEPLETEPTTIESTESTIQDIYANMNPEYTWWRQQPPVIKREPVDPMDEVRKRLREIIKG